MTTNPRILIVEDENIVALDIQSRLKRLGYAVPMFVGSGEEAIAKSAEFKPDLILMDIKLKGEIDGIDAAQQIKDQLGIHSIYLTAFADEATLLRARQTEPLGYIVKPFEEQELIATIRMALYRLQIDRQLRDSEQKFRGIIEQARDGVFLVDSDGQIVEWNPAHEAITGVSRKYALDHFAWDVWYQLIPEKYKSKTTAPYLKSRIQQIMKSGQLPENWRVAETDIQCSNGKVRTLESRMFFIERNKGHMVGSVCRDVTESKRLDEAMRQAQKIESLGILAGGAAHDFNNLLVAMLGQTSLAMAKLPTEHPAVIHLNKAVKAAERASDLTQQMLAISGRGQFEKRMLNFNQLIMDELDLLRAFVPKNIELALELADSLPFIEADHSQMQQIITNLVLNATEAIGDAKGMIRIRTAVQNVSEGEIRSIPNIGTSLLPGMFVKVTVKDDGPGMLPETMAKVFDPFFSTKKLGRGLGLSAVVGIVRGHQGSIKVDSNVGEGTTFSLLFPEYDDVTGLTDDKQKHGWDTPVSTSDSRSANHVLVIDDEESVCEAATDILDLADIPVLTAIGGQKGVEVYLHHHEDISLVLLDLSMPGMDGNETFQALRKINPDVAVILSSGYDEIEVSRRFDKTGLVGFLKKPYNLGALIEIVKQHMG